MNACRYCRSSLAHGDTVTVGEDDVCGPCAAELAGDEPLTEEKAVEIVTTALLAYGVVEHMEVPEVHGNTIYLEINDEPFVVKVLRNED